MSLFVWHRCIVLGAMGRVRIVYSRRKVSTEWILLFQPWERGIGKLRLKLQWFTKRAMKFIFRECTLRRVNWVTEIAWPEEWKHQKQVREPAYYFCTLDITPGLMKRWKWNEGKGCSSKHKKKWGDWIWIRKLENSKLYIFLRGFFKFVKTYILIIHAQNYAL